MNITFFLQTLGHTGGSLAIYKHCDELTRLGHNINVVLPTGLIKWEIGTFEKMLNSILEKQKNFKALIKKIDLKFTKGSILKKYQSLKKSRSDFFDDINKLTKQLIQFWPPSDITIATYWTTAFAAALLSEQTTSLYYMQHYEEVFFPFKDVSTRLKCRMTYGLPIHLIANSLWLQEQIIKRFQRKTYLINHAIIDPKNFELSSALIRSKFSKFDPVKIVSYCDPRPFKGWNYSIEAMKIVQKKYPNIIWQTFGSKLPNEDVKVTTLGRMSNQELAKLYQDSHIGFLFSNYESFPLQPLEMMSAGCATITTPLGTEAYAKDKINCLISKPRDPKDLAESLMFLIENKNLATKLALNGSSSAKEFTWEKSSQQLLNIINNAQKNSPFADIPQFLSN